MHRRNRFTPAAVAAVAALAVAGSGSAVAAHLITGKEIANESLTGADIRNRSVSGSDLKKNTVALSNLRPSARQAMAGARGPAGPTGAPGPKGDKGDKGDTGARGPSDAFITRKTTHTISNNGTRTVATLTLPPGTYLVNAKASIMPSNSGGGSCRLRTGVATDLDTAIYSAGAGQTLPLAVSAAVAIPADATSFNTQVRLFCLTQGDSASVDNAFIAATQVAHIAEITE